MSDKTVTQPVERTSEKLVALQTAYAAAWAAMIAITNPLSKEAKDAKLAVLKLDGEMKAEEANIIKLENEAKLAEQRNARVALFDAAITAYDSLKSAPKNATAEQKGELQLAYDAARDKVITELLAKYAGNKPAAAKSDDGEKTPRNSENKEAILNLARSGKNHQEIEAEGFARSTVWHTIDKAKKAGETFPNA